MPKNQIRVNDMYDHLYKIIQSDDFLQMLGLGNEVPFFICPYPPEQEIDINIMREGLVNKLHEAGVMVLDIDLYDLCVQILKQRGIWARTLEKEVQIDKPKLKELLSNVLDPEQHLVPAIVEKMKNVHHFDVMFLSGVGQIFPYIRSHSILNNLQSKAEDKPTVIFFPGGYTHSLEEGAALNLFNKLNDDKYYRAFNILDYRI